VIKELNWVYVVAVVLMCVGVWVIAGAFREPKINESQKVDVLVGTAKQARVEFSLGASSLVVTGGAAADRVIEGTSGTAMSVNARADGDLVTVDVDAGPSFIPFIGPDGGSWVFRLNNTLPMSVKLEGGASSYDLNFADVNLSSLSIESGASSAKIVCPANAGETLVKIEGGAASFDLRVPAGVAARVRVHQGATAVNVDESRFPVNRDGNYESADYATAQNRVDIEAELGAGSISVK
jgi:hypothetical protein